jgi:hypothetical protein
MISCMGSPTLMVWFCKHMGSPTHHFSNTIPIVSKLSLFIIIIIFLNRESGKQHYQLINKNNFKVGDPLKNKGRK